MRPLTEVFAGSTGGSIAAVVRRTHPFWTCGIVQSLCYISLCELKAGNDIRSSNKLVIHKLVLLARGE